MTRASTLPAMNPVLARELKQRMRGRHTWLVLTLYLGLLALILRWVYVAASRTNSFDGVNVLGSASVGRAIFQWLLFFMLLLVCFIVPGLTAAAISGERERQTLVSLQISLLRPQSIVLGKLLASLAFVVLLIVASLPLVTIPFLVGGVTVAEVASGLVMVLATAVVLACLALACSAVLRRTQAATVAAYGITLALVLGTLVVYGAQQIPRSNGQPRPRPWILALNPFAATADVVQGRNPSGGFESPFQPLVSLLRLNENDRISKVLAGQSSSSDGTFFAPSGPIFPNPGNSQGPGPFIPFPTTLAPPAATTAVPARAGNGPVPAIAPPTVPAGLCCASGVGVGVAVAPFPPQIGNPTTVAVSDHVHLAGVAFWLVALLGWSVLGVAALALAVRRISLPAARESR